MDVLNAVPHLTKENAFEITLNEMEARSTVSSEENEARLNMLYSLLGKVSLAGFEERLGAISGSAVNSMEMVAKEELEAREALTGDFVVQRALMRRIELGQVDSAQYEDVLNEEENQRKKMQYLEDRTFRDVAALEKLLRFNGDEHQREVAIRQQTSGMHCVRLFDGCPFINPRHCPFHSADWIDSKSLNAQHFQKKYPRLKYDRRASERTYQQIVGRRFERMQNMDCRLFVSRSEKGLSGSAPPVRPN